MRKMPADLKILLPIDGSEHSKRALRFAARLGISLGRNLKHIALLRVVTGRYMRNYVSFLDFRSEILKQTDSFKKFKQRHLKENVLPSLDEGEKILKETGIAADIEKRVVEGEPSREIIRVANEERFSSIIMARRGLSGITGLLLGSVTNKVVHAAIGQTIYIVGQSILEDKKCPISKILIPVDGSRFAFKGVEHGAFLAREMENCEININLLRVVNLAFYERRLLEGTDIEEEAKNILEKAKNIILKRKVPETFIATKVRVGDPSEEILKEAEEGKYDLILIGRKGRTAFKDFILGGVSSNVMNRCQNQTVAIVSSK